MKIYVHTVIRILLLKKKIKSLLNFFKSLGLSELKLLPILLIEINFKFEKDLL